MSARTSNGAFVLHLVWLTPSDTAPVSPPFSHGSLPPRDLAPAVSCPGAPRYSRGSLPHFMTSQLEGLPQGSCPEPPPLLSVPDRLLWNLCHPHRNLYSLLVSCPSPSLEWKVYERSGFFCLVHVYVPLRVVELITNMGAGVVTGETPRMASGSVGRGGHRTQGFLSGQAGQGSLSDPTLGRWSEFPSDSVTHLKCARPTRVRLWALFCFHCRDHAARATMPRARGRLCLQGPHAWSGET